MNSCDSEDEVPNLELSDSDQDLDVLMDDEVNGSGQKIVNRPFVKYYALPTLKFLPQNPPLWIDDSDVEEDDSNRAVNAELPLPLRLLFVFLLMWQYNFHISDSGIAVLIVFLHNFLRLLSSLSRSQFVSHMAAACPTSLYSARNILRLHDKTFIKYAVCPKCNSIYDTEQCIGKTASGSECSKYCWYVPFPIHPRRKLRMECGAQLLDSMHLRSGNVFFRPKKVFCYQSLKESITHLFQQEIFTESIQHWRERNVPGEKWETYMMPIFGTISLM